jgi:limonene-1,2-epoxide hydrolase
MVVWGCMRERHLYPAFVPGPAWQRSEDPMQENERIVREFIGAWSRLDPAELAGYFADDGVYHNMPAGPVAGRDNVEKLIRGFIASWTETTWDVLNVLCSGDVVIAERLDRTRAGGKSVDLPCVGVFELEAGKIKTWRDYFDLATYQRGLA